VSKAAIAATYVDFKNVKTRRVLQIVFEVPAHEAEQALKMLGIPDAAQERWFAIAALKNPEATPSVSEPTPAQVTKPQPERAKRDWRDLLPSQQAALRCNDATFRAFLREQHGMTSNMIEGAADWVRHLCGVESRSDLDQGKYHAARVIWHQLDSQYQAWAARERVGA